MEKEKKSRPLYFSIKEDIKQRIQNGEFKPGDVLPTESVLCEEYGASRVTIRRSMEELIEEGIVERGFGKTARVKCESVPRSLNQLSGLHEELSKQGIKCSSFVLSSEIEFPTQDLMEKMKIGEDEKVLKIERLRYANGQPLCYQLFFTLERLCPDLDVKRLTTESMYEIMEHEYNVKISKATQTISATMSNYRMTALLELPEQTCMLKICRIAVTDDNTCIEYSESYYVSNRYSLTMTMKR